MMKYQVIYAVLGEVVVEANSYEEAEDIVMNSYEKAEDIVMNSSAGYSDLQYTSSLVHQIIEIDENI